MYQFITLFIITVAAQAHAELVINPDTQLPNQHLPVYTWRSGSEIQRQLQPEIDKLLKIRAVTPPSYRLSYAYINKKNSNGGFSTYLVDLVKGRIIDTFPSLVGYNGMGCGKGQTPPGVHKLTAKTGTGKSRKRHWGNNWLYYDMDPVAGFAQCKDDSEVVVHSNINLAEKTVDSYISSKSAGCFTVPPERLAQMHKYAGNAYIYNVP